MKNSYQFHRERRAALIASMREHSGGGLALVPTAPEVPRNRDSLYPVPARQLLLLPDRISGARSGGRARRLGRTATATSCSAARRTRSARSGTASATAPMPRARSSASTRRIRSPSSTRSCPTSRATGRRCSRRSDCSSRGTGASRSVLNEVRARVRTGVSAPDEVVDVRGTLDAMRLVKDAHEADLMRRAGAISSGAHRRAMERTRPGWYEYQAEAELVHEFLQAGAQAVAYPSIVASGPNACVLHYRDNNRADERRRAAADRRRLRVPGLRVRHHAHVSRERQVQRAAEGRLRARARLAARVPRRGEAGRRLPRLSQGRGARARAGLHRPRPVRRDARRACSRAAATSSSTCIAPATGSAWTCTTRACTR